MSPLRPPTPAAAAAGVLLAGMAALGAGALWMASAFHGNALDDAYVSFRYATHLAEGLGLAFNPGEWVEGYSNFLWTALLAVVSPAVDDLTRPAIALGVLASLACLPLMRRALVEVFGIAGTAPLAVAVSTTALCGYVTAWAVSGLESGLHGLLLLGAWYRFDVERRRGGPPLSAFLVAALALLRPEGIFVAVAAVALRLGLVGWPGRARWVAVVAVVLGGYHAWRFWYFGPFPFPNSVYAKVGATSSQLARGASYFAWQFLVPCAPLLLGALLLRRPGPQRLAAASGAALVYGQLLFVVAVGGDWSQGRFFAPIVPLASVLFAAASAPFLGRWVLRALVALWVLWMAGVTTSPELDFRRQFADKDRERIEIGRWLASHAPEDAVIAVAAAGQVPYYSRRYCHDMFGLTDARIGKRATAGLGRGVAGHEKHDLDYTLRRVRPDLIVGGDTVRGFARHPVVRSQYRRVSRWPLNHVMRRRDVRWLE